MTTAPDAGKSLLSTADVLDRIEERIVDGSLAPGTQLPSERQLSLDYGVSRPVIREALRGLEERGHITVAPGRGSFVRRPSGHDLAAPLTRLALRVGVTPKHIVLARITLECAAAETAATVADAAQIESLRLALARHAAATTIDESVETDIAFHEEIIRCAGNPVTEIMFGSIRTLTMGMMLRSHADGRVHAAGDPLHERIFAGIAAHDPVEARSAMHEHISLALDLYGDDLNRDLSEVLRNYLPGANTAKP